MIFISGCRTANHIQKEDGAMTRRTGLFGKSFGRDTLRGQMYWTLLTSAMIPLIMTGTLALYSITSILDNKIEKGIEGNLQRVLQTLETTLNNLYDVSQQMSFEGFVGQDMERLMETEDPYEAAQLNNDIQRNINLLNASNLNTGLMFYYDSNKERMMYETLLTRDKRPDLTALPTLAVQGAITYHSPHLTLYKYNDTPVFSIVRKMGNPEHPLYAYVETNSKVLQQVLNMKQYGMNAYHLLTDKNGVVLYSDKPDWFPEGSVYHKQQRKEYYAFEETAKQGWNLVVFISKQDYHRESRTWMVGFSLVAGLALIISLMLALRIWKVVLGPLQRMHRGIRDLTNRRVHVGLPMTGLKEFDYLIDRFNGMHHQIGDLILEVEHKAKEQQEIEMEKLMAQINPHFLYNTVNTAQWLARMNGQHEIDRFLSLFTKVLKYNLAKSGKIVALRDEIQSLKDYVELQQIRYDYEFDVRYEIPQGIMNTPMPRFILQPLVENALYHGLPEEGGVIVVSAVESPEGIRIEVRDNGRGMTPAQIEEMLHGEKDAHNSSGMGIGLNYVIRSLNSFSGGRSKLEITSTEHEGTTVSITMPDTGEDGAR